MQIIDLNGRVIKPKLDPKKTAIEDVIRLLQQEEQDELSADDVLTVIISELARTKSLVLRMSDIIKDQDVIIKSLNNGKSALE